MPEWLFPEYAEADSAALEGADAAFWRGRVTDKLRRSGLTGVQAGQYGKNVIRWTQKLNHARPPVCDILPGG